MDNTGAEEWIHVWQTENVLDLFASGGGPWLARGWPTEYPEFASALNDGWIQVSRVGYRVRPIPVSESEDLEQFLRAAKGSGGSSHARLKWSAWH